MLTLTITDLADPNLDRFSWTVDQRSHNKYPTGKIDYNLTENQRLTFSGNYQHIYSTPDTLNNRDPQFPGSPAQTKSPQSWRYRQLMTHADNLTWLCRPSIKPRQRGMFLPKCVMKSGAKNSRMAISLRP